MREVLKTYQIELITKGPVFIGSGKEIHKKEYVFLDSQTIGIISPEKLYLELCRKGKAKAFESYLLSNQREDLSFWLRNEAIRIQDIYNCIHYCLNCEEMITAKPDRRNLQIMECMKDPYGKPYIPGSSLKGMLRTILLGNDILENRELYSDVKQEMTDELCRYGKVERKQVLKNPINQTEAICYRTLKRPGIRTSSAVNDILQGFIVSDSEPLALDDLTLAQAIELHTNGTEKTLPLLYESIKPGTRIRFTLTINASTCPLDIDYLRYSIDQYTEQLNMHFLNRFPICRMPQKHVILGGNGGFLSKTVIYPLYGKKDGIRIARQIFDKTGVSRNHKHSLDDRYGVSPHILKAARYQGNLCKIGLCELNISG